MKVTTASALLLPAISAFLPLAAANPPACLIAAIGEQEKPADLGAICGDDAKDVQAAIDSACQSENKSVAQEAFLSTCSAAGSSVAAYTPTSTSTASGTASTTGSGASNTASEIAASAGATASASGTGASGSSGASDAKAFNAALVVVVGALGLAVGL